MMEKTLIDLRVAAFLAGLTLSACASTDIETEDVYSGATPLAKPDQVIVFDFAVSPDEVELEHGLAADVKDLVEKAPRSEKEREIGQTVSNALAEKLVEDLRGKGLPVVRAGDLATLGERRLLVKGQFVSIDEGNRTERMVIGLGLGRSKVETRVQLYEPLHGREQLLEQLEAETKSGRKPGMAEMMGVGALAGHLLTSTVLSGGLGVASESLSTNVTALSKTMAQKVAAEILEFYKKQGWN